MNSQGHGFTLGSVKSGSALMLSFLFICYACVLTAALPSLAATVDSTEAAKVAAWLRSEAPADRTSSHFSIIGLSNLNGLGTTADTIISSQGPAAFYQNTQATLSASKNITSRIGTAGPVMQAGGITAFRDVQNLPWGMIEHSQGQYNFSLLDLLVQNYQTYSVDYIAVAMPFASWDLASRSAAAAVCQHFFTEDYKYLAYAGKMDRYVNLDAFITMLQTAVERYDGDGLSDMSGLQRSIEYWQLHNEPEGADCGQFRGDVASFVEFMRLGYNAVKAACPTCQVLNGGVGVLNNTVAGGSFWWDYANLGGNAYIDIIALHYNEGKHTGEQDVSSLETFIANGKDALGSTKPIWITEFGVMINAPSGGSFVSMTEIQAAAWYTRFYTAGLNAGVTKFFSDSMSFFTTGQSVTLLLPYYTNKLLEAKIGGFTASTKLATGQYRFTMNGSFVYVLWSGVPAELTGTVSYYDIYGNSNTGNAGSLNPSQESPLIVILQGCSISSTSQTFTSAAGTGSVAVTALTNSFAWTTTNSLTWVTITSGSSGTGNGTVNFSGAANTTGAARTGNITIAGQTFTVTQESSCAATLTSSLSLHLPIITYQRNSYWADFQNVPNTLNFKLTNANTVSDTSPYSGCTPASLSSDSKLHVPVIIFNGSSYWADFLYTGGVNFSFVNAGGN